MGYEKQDTSRTNQELLEENFALKQRIQELEHSESERKQVEKEALTNRLIFQQTLIDTIPHPIFFKDVGGRFVGCNRAYEREFGITRAYMIGKTVLDLDYLPIDERQRFQEEDMRAIREVGRYSYELPIVYADGQIHMTLYSVDGFTLADGKPGGLIGMLVDITERKRAEQLEKERVESELRIAYKIQANMLPRTFPPFPEMAHVNLYATMEPAWMVAGDFFDFFVLKDKHLCFCIGDVSGKGVPAALFMVNTMNILRHQSTRNPSLDQVFHHANAMLCSGNDESMFVTLFMGILDTKTGQLEYISAGHNPPLISLGGRNFEFLKVEPSPIMGISEESSYRSHKTVMAPGDMLFLYTDGVTEAMNADLELFGNDRTTHALNALKGKPVREVIQGMREAIDGFTAGAQASDDVTMLAVTLTAL
jgi:PAS domain S-box-containing protein